MDEHVRQFVVKAGQVVHFGGIPFRLVENTIMEGHPENIKLATKHDDENATQINWSKP